METADQTAAIPAAPTTIDLSPFCDPDAQRFAIQKPWTKDGVRYATDGRVAVRLDVPGQPDEMPEGRVPNVDSVMPPVDGEWLPWPEVEPCEACGGEEKIECRKCGGDGQCEGCSCGTCHECGRCDGTGESDCDKCFGPGSFPAMFGDAELSRHYAFIVSKLPGVSYLPPIDSGSAVRFKFDGGDGAVMPMRKEKD